MSFIALENWSKTPIDFGIHPDKVDPCYLEAMFCIKSGLNMGQTAVNKRHTTPRPHG